MKKVWILCLMLALLQVVTAFPCYADTQEQLEQKKSDAEAYLEELNGQFASLTQEYDDLQVKYEDTNYQLRRLEKELDSARGAEAEQREGMKTRIRYMYENSMDVAGFASLLATNDFMEFLTAANQMNELTKFDRQMLEQYQEICDLIQETQEQVEKEQKSVAELKKGSLEKQKEIKTLIGQTTEQIEQYTDEIDAEKDRRIQELVAQLQLQAETAAVLVEYQYPVDMGMTSEDMAWAADLYQGDTVWTEETAVLSQDAVPQEEEAQAQRGGYSEGFVPDNSWGGSVLTAMAGVNEGPTGRETYYNMEMSGVVDIMRGMGNTDDYWVRDDGVKMLGDYVMVAANLDSHPRGSIVDSSLGKAIVCDTGGFAAYNSEQLDIATAW